MGPGEHWQRQRNQAIAADDDGHYQQRAKDVLIGRKP